MGGVGGTSVRDRAIAAAVAVAAVLSLGALSGCVSLDPVHTVNSARRATKGGHDPLRDLLSKRADLQATEDLYAFPFAHDPTLDFCGGDFPSEAKRQRQWSVTVLPDAQLVRDGKVGPGDGLIEERSARYQPGGAKVALDELRMAVARCDPDEWIDGGSYGYDRKFDVQAGAPPIAGLPADAIVVPYLQTTGYDLGDVHQDALLVAMRRGDVLVVVDGDPVRTRVIAEDAAKRLRALAAKDVRE